MAGPPNVMLAVTGSILVIDRMSRWKLLSVGDKNHEKATAQFVNE